jgi:hypothetical protein
MPRSARPLLVGLIAVGLAVACSSGSGNASGKELSAARLPRNRSDAVVFMSVGASKLQTSDVRAALRRSDAVRRFAFVSPDEGLAQARKQSPDNTALRDADPSALPASFTSLWPTSIKERDSRPTSRSGQASTRSSRHLRRSDWIRIGFVGAPDQRPTLRST